MKNLSFYVLGITVFAFSQFQVRLDARPWPLQCGTCKWMVTTDPATGEPVYTISEHCTEQGCRCVFPFETIPTHGVTNPKSASTKTKGSENADCIRMVGPRTENDGSAPFFEKQENVVDANLNSISTFAISAPTKTYATTKTHMAQTVRPNFNGYTTFITEADTGSPAIRVRYFIRELNQEPAFTIDPAPIANGVTSDKMVAWISVPHCDTSTSTPTWKWNHYPVTVHRKTDPTQEWFHIKSSDSIGGIHFFEINVRCSQE